MVFVVNILWVVAQFHFSSKALLHHIIFENFFGKDLIRNCKIAFGCLFHWCVGLLRNSVGSEGPKTGISDLLNRLNLVLKTNCPLFAIVLISDRRELHIMNIQLWSTDSFRSFGWGFVWRSNIGYVRLMVIVHIIILALSNWFELFDLICHASILFKAVPKISRPSKRRLGEHIKCSRRSIIKPFGVAIAQPFEKVSVFLFEAKNVSQNQWFGCLDVALSLAIIDHFLKIKNRQISLVLNLIAWVLSDEHEAVPQVLILYLELVVLLQSLLLHLLLGELLVP